MVLTVAELLAPPENIARQAAMATIIQRATFESSAMRSMAEPLVNPSHEKAESFSSGLSEPEVVDRARADIKTLAENVRTARTLFDVVKEVVHEIDRLMIDGQIHEARAQLPTGNLLCSCA